MTALAATLARNTFSSGTRAGEPPPALAIIVPGPVPSAREETGAVDRTGGGESADSHVEDVILELKQVLAPIIVSLPMLTEHTVLIAAS